MAQNKAGGYTTTNSCYNLITKKHLISNKTLPHHKRVLVPTRCSVTYHFTESRQSFLLTHPYVVLKIIRLSFCHLKA